MPPYIFNVTGLSQNALLNVLYGEGSAVWNYSVCHKQTLVTSIARHQSGWFVRGALSSFPAPNDSLPEGHTIVSVIKRGIKKNDKPHELSHRRFFRSGFNRTVDNVLRNAEMTNVAQ